MMLYLGFNGAWRCAYASTVHDATLMHPTLGCGVLAWVFTVHDATLCTLRWVVVFWFGCLRCMTLRLCTLR
ncbi:hypothetical protein [Oceanospirillum multiglobuliferum]|uniref:hypothetical protein n=1 Tax=Oceanospirillum multiglobuliferum TaxID=64969 RepID=UPI00111B4F5E|nr:hypothetical protein [Oceanospirillum multiglobuliferum]